MKFVIMEQVTVQVYFVDEGFEELLFLDSVRSLPAEFARLPAQSCKCILGGVQPIQAQDTSYQISFKECNAMWPKDSSTMLTELKQNKEVWYIFIPPKDGL